MTHRTMSERSYHGATSRSSRERDRKRENEIDRESKIERDRQRVKERKRERNILMRTNPVVTEREHSHHWAIHTLA